MGVARVGHATRHAATLSAAQVSSRHELYPRAVALPWRRCSDFGWRASEAGVRRGQAGQHVKHLLITKSKATVVDHQQRARYASQNAAAEARKVGITTPDLDHGSETLDHAEEHKADKEGQTNEPILECGSRIGIHDIDDALTLPQVLHLRDEIPVPEVGMIPYQIPRGACQ